MTPNAPLSRRVFLPALSAAPLLPNLPPPRSAPAGPNRSKTLTKNFSALVDPASEKKEGNRHAAVFIYFPPSSFRLQPTASIKHVDVATNNDIVAGRRLLQADSGTFLIVVRIVGFALPASGRSVGRSTRTAGRYTAALCLIRSRSCNKKTAIRSAVLLYA